MTTFGTSVLAGVAVGGGLGLLLGGLALWFSWRQMEPRMTSVAQSYRTTGIPTTPLDDLDRGEAGAIVRRWETMSARPSSRIALVAADRKLEPLAHRRGGMVLRAAGPEGGAGDAADLPVVHDRRPTMVATGLLQRGRVRGGRGPPKRRDRAPGAVGREGRRGGGPGPRAGQARAQAGLGPARGLGQEDGPRPPRSGLERSSRVSRQSAGVPAAAGTMLLR